MHADGDDAPSAAVGHRPRRSPCARRRDGTLVAFANHRNEVLVGDVASGRVSVVDPSEHGRSEDLAWSPDGAWLAYTFWTDARHCAIKLHERRRRRPARSVTQPEFRDYSPSFDPDGQVPLLPVDAHVRPGVRQRAVRAVVPARGAPVSDRAAGRRRGRRSTRRRRVSMPEIGRNRRGRTPNGERAAPMRVDLRRHRPPRRRVSGPREQASARSPAWPDGKVIWTVLPIVGAHGRGGHKERPASSSCSTSRRCAPKRSPRRSSDFVARRATTPRSSSATASGCAPFPPNRKLDAARAAAPTEAPSRKSGWIDLDRVRVVGRSARASGGRCCARCGGCSATSSGSADMSGIDWNAVYAPLRAAARARGDARRAVRPDLGDAGRARHVARVRDGRRPSQAARRWRSATSARELQASTPTTSSYEIARIVRGDPWDAGADSPLNAIGVEAKVGRAHRRRQRPAGVARALPPQALLVHQAGAKVELTLERPASDGDARDVIVTDARRRGARALSRMGRAQPRAGCTRSRTAASATSTCRTCMAAGFAEFHRYFSAECDRDALIVDVRYNRGGHVSQLLLEKVARRRIGYDAARWMRPAPYPDEAVAGPVVALTNEHAGSDGDIFSHNFKLMRIGPLVGTRTWGGVIGIWPRHTLVDGTRDDAAGVLVLVQRRRLGRRELRHRSRHRGRQRAAGRAGPDATGSSRRRSRPRSSWSKGTGRACRSSGERPSDCTQARCTARKR